MDFSLRCVIVVLLSYLSSYSQLKMLILFANQWTNLIPDVDLITAIRAIDIGVLEVTDYY